MTSLFIFIYGFCTKTIKIIDMIPISTPKCLRVCQTHVTCLIVVLIESHVHVSIDKAITRDLIEKQRELRRPCAYMRLV